MKEIASLLFMIVFFLSGTFAGKSSQRNLDPSDSSKLNSPAVVLQDSLSKPMAPNPDINKPHKYVTIDCPVVPPDSTYPRMKVFVPDAELTDSMPIFKPQILDEGIFMRKGECFKIVPQN